MQAAQIVFLRRVKLWSLQTRFHANRWAKSETTLLRTRESLKTTLISQTARSQARCLQAKTVRTFQSLRSSSKKAWSTTDLPNSSCSSKPTPRKWRTWWTKMEWSCIQRASSRAALWQPRITLHRIHLEFSIRTRIACTKRTKTWSALCQESHRPLQWIGSRKVSLILKIWSNKLRCSMEVATNLGRWKSLSQVSYRAG